MRIDTMIDRAVNVVAATFAVIYWAAALLFIAFLLVAGISTALSGAQKPVPASELRQNGGAGAPPPAKSPPRQPGAGGRGPIIGSTTERNPWPPGSLATNG